GIVVMPLIGDLGPARLADVQRQALEAIVENAARHLLLDVTGVPALDREGADAVFATIDAARLLGCAVALVGVGPALAEALAAIPGVRSRVACFSTLQAALRSLRRAA
ncbi:MAG TPA: STAS domain-containing protein, partial [Herpetosiphonaceae bacterium]